MHSFDYTNITDALLTTDIVNLLSAIYEYKGRQNLFIESKADILSSLLKVAKIQSTESSNLIEGIFTSDKRIGELVRDKAEPHDRNESEIAGYRDVLALIHENYDYMAPRSKVILQLHRDLYKYSPSSIGGRYKNVDNFIEEQDIEGHKFIRFKTMPAFETPAAMDALCDSFLRELDKGEADALLLIAVFIFDFLCIHPFNAGNGRMSRLLTLLLLYRSGYIVGKYISIEMLIEKSKNTYYEALQDGSEGWHDNKNSYQPFARYYLGVILNAYKEFSLRIEYLTNKSITKAQRIEEILKTHLGKMTMVEIQGLCPDISYSTITKSLNALINKGTVLKIGGGRYSAYVYNHEQ